LYRLVGARSEQRTAVCDHGCRLVPTNPRASGLVPISHRATGGPLRWRV